jgi:hypothetical protein
MAKPGNVEGFRLCRQHLVDQLQDVRKLLDHTGRQGEIPGKPYKPPELLV